MNVLEVQKSQLEKINLDIKEKLQQAEDKNKDLQDELRALKDKFTFTEAQRNEFKDIMKE